MRVAELLRKHAVSGTFYISPQCREIPADERLTGAQVRELAHAFEIGAHTMTHPRLTEVSSEVARQEIVDSKKFLEDVLGSPVSSFCYPGGAFIGAHKAMVKDAGFTFARTVERFEGGIGDPFAAPTTIHAYRHYSDALGVARHMGKRFLSGYLNWDELATTLFDEIAQDGGVFHLWGHSWEIEKNSDWERLERVLAHIGKRKEVAYVQNCALV